jgi:hypothetical protein
VAKPLAKPQASPSTSGYMRVRQLLLLLLLQQQPLLG